MATRRGRTQAYAAGNKVYGGGRPMPTIGPVDKTGYRERDAKGMIWKNALQRRLGVPGGIGGSNSLGASAMPGAQPERNYGGQGGLVGETSDSLKPRPLTPRTATGQPSSTQSQGAVAAPSVNSLTASPSGQMSGQASQGMNGLPYDPAYEGVRRAIEGKRAAKNAGIAQQKANWDLEANSQKRDIDREAPKILRELLDRFAGRGMAFSGKYGTDQGEQQNQFASMKSKIDQILAANNSGLDAEMANFEAGLQSELSDAEYAYARSVAQNAGNLGIVQDGAPAQEAPVQPEMGMTGNNPAQQYQPPVAPVQQTAPLDLASRPGGTRPMTSFDPKSRAVLANGGTIVGGNGYTYKYDPHTSQTIRVA